MVKLSFVIISVAVAWAFVFADDKGPSSRDIFCSFISDEKNLDRIVKCVKTSMPDEIMKMKKDCMKDVNEENTPRREFLIKKCKPENKELSDKYEQCSLSAFQLIGEPKLRNLLRPFYECLEG